MNPATAIALDHVDIARLFFALVFLLSAAHTFGYLFHLFRMPRVIGEIAGGIVLGPSLFGHFFPAPCTWLFGGFAAEGKLLATFYWLGLVLLMFVSGFEIQRTVSRGDRRLILALLLGGTVIPFVAGWLAPHVCDLSAFLGPKGSPLTLNIVVGIAVAVTSIPVISKIFLDLHLIHTRFAKIVLATATIEDVILWVALAVVTGIVSTGDVSVRGIVMTVLLTFVFFALGLLVMPRWLQFGNTLRVNLLVRSSVTGYALLICLAFAALASVMNINLVFGALLAGVVIGAMPHEAFARVRTQIKELSLGFFVPIYFAVVGLKLDLVHHLDVPALLAFLAFATVFKTVGTLVAARLARQDWRSSFNLAVAMNTRGGPGIVLATVAYDLGIISERFFVILVLVAILTSLLAGYWFGFVLSRGWDLLTGEEAPALRLEPGDTAAATRGDARNGAAKEHSGAATVG